eukprot:scpid24934/ scgid17145/ 
MQFCILITSPRTQLQQMKLGLANTTAPNTLHARCSQRKGCTKPQLPCSSGRILTDTMAHDRGNHVTLHCSHPYSSSMQYMYRYCSRLHCLQVTAVGSVAVTP